MCSKWFYYTADEMKALKRKNLGGIHMQSTAGSSYGAMHIHNIH